MLIYAHRGASDFVPENTLAAFETAIRDGADGIEFDVQATADGVPVVIHDRDVSRTTSGQGHVDELPFEMLRAFDVGAGHTVPTLAETLDLVGGRVALDIEIKQPRIEREVLRALERYPSTAWVISSFQWEILEAVRRCSATAPVWPLAMTVDERLFTTAASLTATAVAMHVGAVTKTVVEQCRAKKLDLMVWTVNDADRARRLQALGVLAVCTDSPKRMGDAVRDRQSPN